MMTLPKLLSTIAQWAWPEGPFQWAQPETQEAKQNRAAKRRGDEAPTITKFELHMGTNYLQDPKGKWRNMPSGIIFREIVPVNLSPEQGAMFADACALLPDIKVGVASMHMMLEVAQRLLAQVEQSPSADWSAECNAFRAQVAELQGEMPVVEQVETPQIQVVSR